VRKRNSRKSRSTMLLDVRKLYTGGLSADIFRAIDTVLPDQTDLEIDLCQNVLREDPTHVEAMVLLGDAFTRKGEYQKGLEFDLRLSQLKPENKLIRYNLACSYALTGQKDKALTCLNKAIELGYADLDHLKKDTDLDTIKSDPRFQSIIKKMAALQPETSSP
jgi:lipopolysaccharide biosynthesis regulator YciM